MSELARPKSFGEVLSRASEAWAANFLPLYLPFVLVHAALAVPELSLVRARLWLAAQAESGQLQEVIFGFFAHPLQLLSALVGVLALVALIVVAYTYAFGRVAALVAGTAPRYGETFRSLMWFGSVMIVPYGLALAGASVILIPLLNGSGWSFALLLPMLGCFLAAMASAVLVQPLFYASAAPAVTGGSYGRPAFSRMLDAISKRIGEYLVLSLAVLGMGIALSITLRVAGFILPSEASGDISSLLGQGLSLEGLTKALVKPDTRPTWAAIIDSTLDIGLQAARDCYVTLVIIFWYRRS